MVTQIVKKPPAIQKSWVRSLGWEDPLEEGVATHSSILAWRIPWTEEPGRSVDHNVTQGRTQLKQLSTQNTLNCKENEDL